MINALTLNELENKVYEKYGNEQQKIVGIMLARYDLPLTRSLINSCYLYWHYNTAHTLDLYWAGYGEYLCPTNASDSKIILDFVDNNTHVYYDRNAFISIKNEFNKIFKEPYQDKLQLILVNYSNGKLKFKESIKIDLEKNLDDNLATIRELFEFITNECANTIDVSDIARKLKCKQIKNSIKGITISDAISIATGLIGTI